jgi:hypothetical protein
MIGLVSQVLAVSFGIALGPPQVEYSISVFGQVF